MEYPARPAFNTLVGDASRMALFGHFDYKVKENGEVSILGDWVEKNISTIEIPELVGIKGAPHGGIVVFHNKVADPVRFMFEEFQQKDLLKYILTWDGSFYPRLIRGGTSLSNHAFGSAFDINAQWNPLGVKPPSGKGTVWPLIEIVNKHGFYWGGHYKSRLDGMHLEWVGGH